MAIWICRLLPWVLFVPSIMLWLPALDNKWSFLLGMVNAAFAALCGQVAGGLKKLR